MKEIIAIQNFELQAKKKLIYYLESYKPGKVLIIFDHGLGDLVEFFQIFNTLQKDYPKWEFKLGYHPTLDFKELHKDTYEITQANKNFVIPFNQSVVQLSNTLYRYDIDKLSKEFKFVFCIQFPDARHPMIPLHQVVNISKLDRCKVLEIGYDDNKILESYVPPFKEKLNNKDSKKVIFHAFGHTDKGIKTPSYEDQKTIWNEILDAGYEPVDVHMNNVTTIAGSNAPLPDFMDPSMSIRNSGSGMSGLIETMLTAKYTVGVLSGPLHLSNVLYGGENCLGLEGKFKISNYIDSPKLTSVNIYPYKKGTVYEWLKNKG